MKKWLVFVLGMLSGAVLIILLALMISNSLSNGLHLFDKPGRCISTNSFKVIQVLDSGDALANEIDGSILSGITVLFYNTGEQSFYDDQVIKVAPNESVRQIGTFKYTARNKLEKTVPVVQVFKNK